ncbi:PIN domain-containing protein [Paraburkholderia acidicola]|uniref:PIN domain-containing protein n=1 Tax=Paraburkholderia acidicola TaxID=1912599 RepID=A0ABV1LI46_9BURK
MNILIDTSVWVDHFRRSNAELQQLLRVDVCVTHPLVVLELTCGMPPEPRAQVLSDIALLRQTRLATHAEVAGLIERERLYEVGCGAVDCTLLASTLLTPDTRFWTLDQRLRRLTERFDVCYVPRVH